MRNLVYLILLVFMSACANNSQCTDKKMRRFTFAAFNITSDTSFIKSIKSDSELQQVLEKSGVVNYNFCTMDSISYLILDMNENFNLDKTKLTFDNLAKDYPQTDIFNEIVGGKYMLLDRIYKMEQNNSYSSSQGQLIPLHKDKYARFVLTLEIINNSLLAKDYIAIHAKGKAWPEITQNMKTVGIHEMELYLTGYRAFLIMDAKPDFDWAVDGEMWGTLPREKEWQAYVAKFQKTIPESKAAEKWKTMQVISMHP